MTGARLLPIAGGLLIMQFFAAAMGRYLLGVAAARTMIDLGRRVHEHLQLLPMAFHERRRSGEVLALFSHDVTTLGHVVSGPLVSILPLTGLLIGCVVMILLTELVFGVAVLVILPLLVVLVRIVGRKARPLASAAIEQQAQSLAYANESLGLMRLSKAHALEHERDRTYRAYTEQVLVLRKRQLWQQALMMPAIYLLAGLVLLGLLWWAGERLRNGILSMPAFVSIGLYGLLMIRPLSGLGGVYLQFEQARGATSRLLAMLREPTEQGYRGGLPVAAIGEGITFDNVSFSYPGCPPVLNSIDLAIKRSDVVALRGANGAGKTTLIHLLLRFITPTGGAVRIDGTDICALDLRDLRRLVGYVPQEMLLANASVRDNIAFGRRDVTPEQLVDAARLAGVNVFVERLPDGYDTLVGERGMALSGGQRQRIALARALLGDPPLLVLDEASSQLDQQAEDAFVAALREALSDRTAIIISHRPAMLRLASRCYQLEDGRLRETAGITT